MSKSVNGDQTKRESIILYYIKTALSLSPMYMFLGAFILWFYLNEIGMTTLFKDVSDSKLELIAPLFSFIILSISFTAIIIYPSLSICKLYFMVGYDNLRREVNPTRIPLATLLSILTTLTFISVSAWTDTLPIYVEKHPTISLVILLTIVSTISTYIISIKRKKEHRIYKNGQFIKYKSSPWIRILVAFFIVFTGMTIALPLSFIFRVSSAYTTEGLVNALFLSVIVSLLSLLPAFIFYSNNVKSNSIVIKTKYFASSSSMIFILILFLFPNLISVICASALKTVGVIDKTEHVFAIEKSSYSPSMFPPPAWKHIASDDENRFYIKGTILFSLGETVLLCPDFVVKTQGSYMKHNFDKIIPDNNDAPLKDLRETFKSCATLKKSAIVRWDTIMDKDNKINLQLP
ncbi:hypothetical protein ACXDR1_002373 [Klebsiella pneumoniae]